MSCKYCHLKNHYTDKCPTIICKICKDVGHPQWLCKQKKNNNGKSTNLKLNLEKKYNYGEDFKKKSYVNNEVQKNISYYSKLQHETWSNLI